ncbi:MULTISPECIES: hypothetical protein [unclassified Xanthomonas]|uniref:hypothetical protein n=1 Tax=unclassified Xanthomonas TaxID=2643310 RepID=UPI002A809FF1|nr:MULTISPECIES: hypothetical protein [unclassified Xanthomonas]MDY4297025.1 hypothetical protein [Xanthomonas sp. LF02-5]MDY4359014.1 hypothetical protein [Xanthomonas sp. LF04-12]
MPVTDFKSKNGFDTSEYFKSKTLEDLDVSELAYIHLDRLNGKTHLSNCIVSSSLYDLIETAQSSFNNRRTRIYTPLLSCFAILDQIGGAYGSHLNSTQYQAGIKVALATFSKYDKDEIEKLYSLRNGLYHDGSLVNISKNGNAKVVFRLSSEATDTITHPTTEWDGIYHDALTQYITKINTRKFKEDVENIVKRCTKELLNGTLTMKISDPREFFYKFLFATPL